jgi:PKD repeat protein
MNKLPVLMSMFVAGLMVGPFFIVSPALADRNPGVDLTLTGADIWFSKDKPIKGETVQINATVKNVGDTNASNVRVRFYDGLSLVVVIGSDQFVDVPYGGSGVARVNWSTASVTNGNHTIVVVVDPASEITEDSEGNNTANRTIFVNLAPTARVSASSSSEFTWNEITFYGANSTDPEGPIKTYFWDFDDGNTTKGAEVKHAWSNNGWYNVSLLVTDNDGGSNNTAYPIQIINRDPVALAYDQMMMTLETVVLDSANSSDADGYIAAAKWTLHNNTVLTGKKVSTIYQQDGVYQVSLNVTDDDGASNEISFWITINNRDPVSRINSTALNINSSENVTFDAYKSYDTDGYITNYTWMYQGGKKEYGPVTTHNFNVANGSYLISLVVIDDDGAVASTCSTVRVGNLVPTAVAGLSTIVFTYENITFDGTKSYDPDGRIVNFTWNFQDGTTSNNAMEQHGFAQDGTYNVTLLVTDNDGATDSDVVKITVLNQRPSAFFPDITAGTYEMVSLNGSYCSDPDGYIANFTWDIGGGTFLYGPEVYTNWTHRGVYEVALTIRDDDGAMASASFNVTINNAPPKAFFWYDPSRPTETEVVTFNASTSSDIDGTITNYTWNFGDGTTGSNVIAQHAYLTNGSYWAVLIITDNDGSSATYGQNISVAKYNAPPVASFIYSPSNPTTTDVIDFNASGSYDTLPGTVKKYEWSWGDGNQTQLIQPRISHRFYSVGVYNVTLTVTDDGGAKSSTYQEIAVTPGVNHPPTAVIYAPSRAAESGTALTFDGSSSFDTDGAIVNFTWDFGDGGQSYFYMSSHVFTNSQPSSKDFTVTLVVKDDGGLTCSTSIIVSISPPVPVNLRPRAVLTAAPTTVFTKELVTLTARGSTDPDGTIAGYTWSFGDGELGSGEQVTHFYQKPGIYVVLLTVKDNLAAAGSATETIYVLNRVPTAKIGPDMDRTQSLEQIMFTAAASTDPDGEIVRYSWDLGDGTLSSKSSVAHTYFHAGRFAVKLTVTDDYGASTSTMINLTVTNRAPLAVLSGSNATGYIGDLLVFDGSKSNDTDGRIANYTWEFGDGITASGPTGEHIYTITGTYQVKLTVADDSGDTSTANMTVTITGRPKPPKPVTPPSKFIPGFELVGLVAALALAAVAFEMRRKK